MKRALIQSHKEFDNLKLSATYPVKYPCVIIYDNNISIYSVNPNVIEYVYLDDFEIKCESCKNWRMISKFKLGNFDFPQTGRCNKLDDTTPFNFGCINFNIYE